MSKLSRDTLRLIEVLYPDNRRFVREIFESNLCPEKVHCEGWSPEQMERIHFAVLKLGQKSLEKLEQAKNVAQRDWRDLLMSAGFGEDVDAHRTWWKTVI